MIDLSSSNNIKRWMKANHPIDTPEYYWHWVHIFLHVWIRMEELILINHHSSYNVIQSWILWYSVNVSRTPYADNIFFDMKLNKTMYCIDISWKLFITTKLVQEKGPNIRTGAISKSSNSYYYFSSTSCNNYVVVKLMSNIMCSKIDYYIWSPMKLCPVLNVSFKLNWVQLAVHCI